MNGGVQHAHAMDALKHEFTMTDEGCVRSKPIRASRLAYVILVAVLRSIYL